MRKKIFSFLTGVAAIACAIPAYATTSVATVPEGMISFPLVHNTTTFLSLPLTKNATYTSVVTGVTTNAIAVDDSPAPFTTNLATAAAPYFVKFLSGNESGRVLLITANSPSLLTLDTTDHVSGSAVALTTTSFNVQVGDTFEIFPGDTLASVFGAGTSQSPLVLTGAANVSASDVVSLYPASGTAPVLYYFNTSAGYWEQYQTKTNANDIIIYPYSAFSIARRNAHPDMTFVLAGRVAEVGAATKVVSNGTVYTSSHYATDITLSQLQFGANWVRGLTAAASDTISVWNSTLGQFDTFFQTPNYTWHKSSGILTNQDSYTITAGTVTTISKHEAVSGATAFLQSSLPYSLD